MSDDEFDEDEFMATPREAFVTVVADVLGKYMKVGYRYPANAVADAILANPDALKAALVEAGVLSHVRDRRFLGLAGYLEPKGMGENYGDDLVWESDRLNHPDLLPLYLWAPETGETPDHE